MTPTRSLPSVAIVGAGPSGLIAAETIARAGLSVTVYDRMPTPGRKFLLAGRGGLNLTHTEPSDRFAARYGPAEARLRAALDAFPSQALIAWCEGLGEPTFVGSSGRVFPRSMKASPVLRKWLARLSALGVAFALKRRWTGWDATGRLLFAGPDGETASVEADAAVFALGGASWPHLGSDGGWVHAFAGAGAAVSPLSPANCGVEADWSPHFRERFAGAPLKSVAATCGSACALGDAVVTRRGLEGGPLYELGPVIRAALAGGEATVAFDLRPAMSLAALAGRLAASRKQSLSTRLRKAGFNATESGFLRETMLAQRRDPSIATPEDWAAHAKAAPVRIRGLAPIARAISTAGGVRLDAVDETLMLRARPGVFVAGEMLDWEAPTGGYLLQGCFATGVAAGRGALRWLGVSEDRPALAKADV
ncbi:MAG: TIGR03862 family flavoprotein [Hyphomicrobiales bacterium]|nr:TIGR03862 family flavoprotein [Hyphomicrobiales bacterium]